MKQIFTSNYWHGQVKWNKNTPRNLLPAFIHKSDVIPIYPLFSVFELKKIVSQLFVCLFTWQMFRCIFCVSEIFFLKSVLRPMRNDDSIAMFWCSQQKKRNKGGDGRNKENIIEEVTDVKDGDQTPEPIKENKTPCYEIKHSDVMGRWDWKYLFWISSKTKS